MLQLSISQLPALFAAMAEKRALYMPIEKNGQVNFAPWNEAETYSADTLKTVKSAKDLFFPQSETIAHFKREGKLLSVDPAALAEENFAIFGVRACDAASFQILDKVFLGEPADQYYKARREHGLVITMACAEPEESCFCNVFGIDATEPGGDISCWMAGDMLYWDAKTESGVHFTEELTGIFSEGDDAPVQAQKTAVKEIIPQLPLSNLSLEGFNGDALQEKFDSPKWKELSEACLGCGACTFVCPTCQCYDVKDYNTGNGIQRFRCWDSCMYSDFTMMAHGNPRTEQMQRFRQRFMHKLIYFPANNDGEYSCVGCGRCVSKCPISMNIAKVIKALGGGEHV